MSLYKSWVNQVQAFKIWDWTHQLVPQLTLTHSTKLTSLMLWWHPKLYIYIYSCLKLGLNICSFSPMQKFNGTSLLLTTIFCPAKTHKLCRLRDLSLGDRWCAWSFTVGAERVRLKKLPRCFTQMVSHIGLTISCNISWSIMVIFSHPSSGSKYLFKSHTVGPTTLARSSWLSQPWAALASPAFR